MTVSAIQRRPDGTIQALDENGWYALRDGDSVDMGHGQIMQVMGPSQIGCGSFKLGGAVLLGGMVVMAVAGMLGFGKGMGS